MTEHTSAQTHEEAFETLKQWMSSLDGEYEGSLEDWDVDDFEDAIVFSPKAGSNANMSLLVRGDDVVSFTNHVSVEEAFQGLMEGGDGDDSDGTQEGGGDAAADSSTDVEDADEKSPDYFDDDEEMLAGDDAVIDEDLNIGIVQQSDTVVSWTVENFYKDNGKPRNVASMRTDPPILSIGNSDGDSVSFVITKEFAGQFESIMGDIYRAYYGVSSKREKQIGRRGSNQKPWEKFKGWILENKIKAGLGAFAILMVLASAFLF